MQLVSRITVILLGLIALLQGLRFILAWEVTVQGILIPVWISGLACVILGVLALLLWNELVRNRK